MANMSDFIEKCLAELLSVLTWLLKFLIVFVIYMAIVTL
jgi:hypothetical protein